MDITLASILSGLEMRREHVLLLEKAAACFEGDLWKGCHGRASKNFLM